MLDQIYLESRVPRMKIILYRMTLTALILLQAVSHGPNGRLAAEIPRHRHIRIGSG